MALSIQQNKVMMTGMKETRAMLLQLPRRLANNVIRRGLYAAAVEFRDAARINAPRPPARSRRGYKRRGLLARSIIAQSRGIFKDPSGKPVGYKAVTTIKKKSKGSGGPNPRRYGHLVERGTRPHAVGRGSNSKLGIQKGLRHPGTPAQRFMERAFDSRKLAAIRAFETRARDQAAVELRKLRSERIGKAAG